MTGLSDTDIRLNNNWQLTQAADGDAPVCSGLDCLEALTQPGDVFYDLDFGWGLYDFIQSEDSDLTRLEITERVKMKLKKREVILTESIGVRIEYHEDNFLLYCSFKFNEESEPRNLNVVIGAVAVEVNAV